MDIVDKIKKDFNNTSDLIIKKLDKVYVIYLESICDSDKVNFYILQNISLKSISSKKNIISGPNTLEIKKYKDILFYLVNGFSVVIKDNKYYAVETRGNIFRGIDKVDTEPSISGPKDSFNESIQINLGLIKRRIKSECLINEDYFIGDISKDKVSVLYLKDKVDEKSIKKVRNKIKSIENKNIISISNLKNMLGNESRSPLPTILETQRPDNASYALLQGKIVIICDNSPYALILPAYFSDFINPVDDNYSKNININFLKILRIFCLIITLFAPALYISLVNYNIEVITLSLLANLASQNSLTPFPTYVEAIIMLITCAILRESDIRFPSSYGSSISIVGALILGEGAVSAGLISPIMIIVVALTFITSMIFYDVELVNSLRIFRFFFLISATLFGIVGLTISLIIFLIHLSGLDILNQSYTYPISPLSKKYLFKTLLKSKTGENI